jgi:hypothetical protein
MLHSGGIVVRWLLLIFFTPVLAQMGPTTTALQRRYVDGSISHYVVTGDNDGWQYTIHATDVVKRDASGSATLPFVIPSAAEGSAVRLHPKRRPYE